MGGKSSKEAPASATSNGTAPGTESGVVLAIDLQNKILQDFQSTVIKEEWEKRQKYLLAKNNKRRMEDFQFQEALKERMAAVRQQQATVQSQLDEKAESLQARFADTSVGMKHDADRLAESLSIQPKVGSSQPCLDVRTNLAKCYRENPGLSSVCDGLVNELGSCVGLGVERINNQGH